MEYYCCFVVFFVALQKKEMDNRQATLELAVSYTHLTLPTIA